MTHPTTHRTDPHTPIVQPRTSIAPRLRTPELILTQGSEAEDTVGILFIHKAVPFSLNHTALLNPIEIRSKSHLVSKHLQNSTLLKSHDNLE